MPREKTVKTRNEPLKKFCTSCKKNKNLNTEYWMSNSKYHADQRFHVCKACLLEDTNSNDLDTVRRTLLVLNRPFIASLWESTLVEAENKKSDPFGLYVKNCQISYKDYTFVDSDKESKENPRKVEPVIEQVNVNDTKNEEDVLRMLGYDPFEYESSTDRRHLFNKLIDFLDEGTLEDSFKLPAVIEIVKSFNQIDKLNTALSRIASDFDSVAINVGGVTSLVTAKEKMLRSVLALAKDNGISVNHNNNKSKGAGTLSGIIKQLHEKGIHAADINVYDIETCEGMRQVADISNRSILEQLMLNENDYTEMIKEQRGMIANYEKTCSKLEEDNRNLLIKIKQYE
ncbi:hypothetical protein [Paenibacillus chitinolyticus]|uniref:hypothetical protein n=1 Tax=Paenibacillus chitinolyticus TaxID=79263 RepID=UPI00367242D8